MAQSKRWCFTLNNYEGLFDWDDLKAAGFTFLVYQEEVGECGTPHLQGYVELSRSQRLTWVKKHLGRSCHLEQANGSPDENEKYCTKVESRVGGPYTHGVRSNGQGHRADLVSFAQAVLDPKKRKLDLMLEHINTYAKHPRLYADLRGELLQKMSAERDHPKLIVWVGPSNTGKTNAVMQWLASQDREAYWAAPANGRACWFDGYECRHSVLVLDEFDGWIPYNNLKRLCDRTLCSLQVKGATSWFHSEYIVIISNAPIYSWWEGVRGDELGPLHKRITQYNEWDPVLHVFKPYRWQHNAIDGSFSQVPLSAETPLTASAIEEGFLSPSQEIC